MTPTGIDDFDLSGLQAPPRRAGWPEAARMAVAAGTGCGLVVLLEFLLIAAGVQALFSATVPEGLKVKLQSPPSAVVGKATPLTLVIRNEGDQPFRIRALAVRGTTQRQFRLSELQPAPAAAKVSLLGTDTWSYNQSVAPGKSWTLKLLAEPVQAGKLRGTLELQVENGTRRVPFEVEVAPAPGPQPSRPTGKA